MSTKPAVRRLGLCGNPGKDELEEAIVTIRRICAARQVSYGLCHELAASLDEPDAARDEADLVAESDVLVALGGDGTMLRAARLIGNAGTPLLGINLGSLGYLTDIPVDGLGHALERVLDGDYLLDGRARVDCTLWRGDRRIDGVTGLNDVVINMGALPRTLDLELHLGGTTLGRWLGDGVIIATPTGSTAYNLSAGGAICAPDVAGLLVTPICPHSLGVRPLVVAGDVDAELVVHEVGDGATLTADGQVSVSLQNGDRLRFRLTEPQVRLVKFPESDFFQVLRHKLNWGVAPRWRPNSRRDRGQGRGHGPQGS
jgi:NAD+ kinase